MGHYEIDVSKPLTKRGFVVLVLRARGRILSGEESDGQEAENED